MGSHNVCGIRGGANLWNQLFEFRLSAWRFIAAWNCKRIHSPGASDSERTINPGEPWVFHSGG